MPTQVIPPQVDSDSTPSFQPYSRRAYVERLRSFTSRTWFNLTTALSPLQCARYGWYNVDINRLYCSECGTNWKCVIPLQLKLLSVDPQFTEEQSRLLGIQLTEKHSKDCLWYENECDECWMYLPSNAAILDDDIRRSIESMSVNKVVNIETSQELPRKTAINRSADTVLESSNTCFEETFLSLWENSILEYSRLLNVDLSDSKSYFMKTSVMLAVCGWSVEPDRSQHSLALRLCCNHCGSMIFIDELPLTPSPSFGRQRAFSPDNNFMSFKPSFLQSSKNSLCSPLNLHAWYCPLMQAVPSFIVEEYSRTQLLSYVGAHLDSGTLLNFQEVLPGWKWRLYNWVQHFSTSLAQETLLQELSGQLRYAGIVSSMVERFLPSNS